ncbi:MAG: methionyl-tRNA formyltransferase [Candidatus Buchananbacteria bacterium]
MDKIKTIFVGTPEFSTHYLNAIINDGRFDVVAVITQSDKPSGRKHEIIQSPVKKIALEKDFKIFQPERLKADINIASELKTLKADLMIVVAYGQIIPKEILEVARYGAINVHPSLLPKYRGASPVQSAILNGEEKTGVTIMLMDEKMDHGPILSQVERKLSEEETNDILHEKLADLSTDLLISSAIKFINGEIKPIEQDHDQATFCRIINKEDAKVDWNKSAQEIKRKIYAFHPWPGTWTMLDGKRIKIFPPTKILKQKNIKKSPGQIIINNNELIVACGEDFLKLDRLQLEGKKEMNADDFLRGYEDLNGKILA